MSMDPTLMEKIERSLRRTADANVAAVELWKRVDERTAKALVPYDPSLMKKLDRLLKEIGERGIAAPPAESEAVELLERWMCWWDEDGGFSGAIAADTRALLAKLKGGAK